jgi:rare lipoprotein A
MSFLRIEAGTRPAALRWLGVAGAALALAGCATSTPKVSYSKGKEHFAQGKYYGKASAKMIADGDPVPRGGGQYLVGKPYHVAGKTYVPTENPSYSATGMASWYGAAFHGRRTSNGEIYDMASLTAAHPTMPLPSYARVTNLSNGYSVIVRVNDRGPFHGGRVMDVSSRTADVLGFKGAGTAKIKVDYVGRAPMEGSDDNTLLASLRTDGSPANLNGYSAPAETMVADSGSSAFGALFQQARAPQSAPAPEPETVRPTPVAPPAPPPEPIQVAAADPTPTPPAQSQEDAAADAAPEPEAPAKTTVAMRQPHGPVPLPPPRPFDLGEIRATLVVASAAEARPAPQPKASAAKLASVTPPRKPMLQASVGKALYFADAPQPPRRATHAFDKVKTAKSDD